MMESVLVIILPNKVQNNLTKTELLTGLLGGYKRVGKADPPQRGMGLDEVL